MTEIEQLYQAFVDSGHTKGRVQFADGVVGVIEHEPRSPSRDGGRYHKIRVMFMAACGCRHDCLPMYWHKNGTISRKEYGNYKWFASTQLKWAREHNDRIGLAMLAGKDPTYEVCIPF